MNWENLKNQKCPYCESEVELDGEWIRCTYCRFTIHSERAIAILSRSNPLWQNLHDRKCPQCGDMLKDGNGKYEIAQCISIECTFKMREDEIARILRDPEHPANRYKQNEH